MSNKPYNFLPYNGQKSFKTIKEVLEASYKFEMSKNDHSKYKTVIYKGYVSMIYVSYDNTLIFASHITPRQRTIINNIYNSIKEANKNL